VNRDRPPPSTSDHKQVGQPPINWVLSIMLTINKYLLELFAYFFSLFDERWAQHHLVSPPLKPTHVVKIS
jgi:hypothetical protein